MNEVDRSKEEYIDSHKNFITAVYRSFTNLNLSIYNLETSMNALYRITSIYKDLDKLYKNYDFSVGLISHGTILSLFLGYKGKFLNDVDKLFDLWGSMPFCGWFSLIQKEIKLNW